MASNDSENKIEKMEETEAQGVEELDESSFGGSNYENGGEVKSRRRRQIITAPETEYVNEGVRYRRDAHGYWRPVIGNH